MGSSTDKPLWQPSEDRKAATNLARFLPAASAQMNRHLGDYRALHAASIEDPGRFWNVVWDTCGVIGDKGAAPYLVSPDKLPGAQFFPQAQLNFSENVVSGIGDGPALVFRGEDKVSRSMSGAELKHQIARVQAMLRDGGVQTGDRVAAILPNLPESIAAVLGAAAQGAVWSSCSPDFGVQGVLDRFGQIEPKVLFACDGYFYAGKTLDLTDKLAEIRARLPSVQKIVVVSYIGRADAVVQALQSQGFAAETWDRAIAARSETEADFVRLPFAHPLYILFSSGTTGVPKCIVHSAGGTLLKHITEHQFHSDIKPGDRVFYFTTLGWMMWNWLVTALGSGATLLLYDGSPFHPTGNVLWDYAAAERCTLFGTSAKYIDALKKAGLEPGKTHDLSALRAVLSTGSPLAPEGFDYVYQGIKADVHLASISGGTDIVGCFVLGAPTEPVWRGEIQAPGLGMAVDVFDDEGHSASSGKGALVCTRPFPSMPVGFWNDPDGKKYHSAYFARFENIWHHGDFAEWTPHGGMIIHGRSDATLNPGGVRIGTAEIYRQVEMLAQIQEAIVVGQNWDSDVRVVLFVVLKPGHEMTDMLKDQIKRQIRVGASPRHVPAKIIQVADIPRTKSGKITELAVRDLVHGREIKNKEALANPEALDLYRDLAELKS